MILKCPYGIRVHGRALLWWIGQKQEHRIVVTKKRTEPVELSGTGLAVAIRTCSIGGFKSVGCGIADPVRSFSTGIPILGGYIGLFELLGSRGIFVYNLEIPTALMFKPLFCSK